MKHPKILTPNIFEYLKDSLVENNDLLLEMEEFARERNIPILERSSAKFLEQLILLYKPKSFLEIGMAIGYSTIRVAKTASILTQIDTIELSKPNIKFAKAFIEKADLSTRINILEGKAQEIMLSSNKEYDFIFLDADKEDYPDLFELSMSKLVKGGIILIDNLLWKGFVASEEIPEKYKRSSEIIKSFNTKFLAAKNLKTTILPIGDGLGLGIKIV